MEVILKALTRPVEGRCGPRQKSVKPPFLYSEIASPGWVNFSMK